MANSAEILSTQVDEKFIQGMKDRMLVSYHKYGDVAEAFPARVDAIASLMQRLRSYADTGNTEYLMDAANFAMIEFMYPKHPKAFFAGTDDDGSPGRISAKTGQADKRNNDEIGKNVQSEITKFR